MSGTVEGAAELLQAHAPYLRYHEDERFRATRAEALVEASLIAGSRTELRQADGTRIASTDPAAGLPPLTIETLCAAGKVYPGTEVTAHRTDLLAGELPDGAAFSGTPIAYTRAVGLDDGSAWLQYWLFSYHNPHHLVGDHQGDWELVQLKVDPARTPQEGGLLAATCWQHGDQDGRDAGDLAPLLGDDGLLTFIVARGSHASYFDFEYVHFGDELQDKAPAERPQLVAVDEAAGWLSWPGYWGKSRVMDHPRSPRGPMMCRAEWFDPQGQHEAGLYQRSLRRKEQVPAAMISTSVAPASGAVSLIAQGAADSSGEELRAAVEGLGAEDPLVTPLHEGSLADPERRQLLVKARVPAGANPFDFARALEDATDGWEVEPDLDSTLFRPSPNAYRVCEQLGTPTADPRWAIERIGCLQAWKHSTGAGIKVGHPDTGYVNHPELREAIVGGYDFLDGDADAHDVLTGIPPFQFPGHGTGTASVLASPEAGPADLVGAAPGAKVVPYRIARSVVLMRGRRLLQAIRRAREDDCRVISISLGGLFLGSALRRELDATVAEGRIVIAAAGQPVRFVVEPASYASTLGVAGTTIEDEPWSLTARGESIDFCAPAAGVPRAEAKSGEVARGDGTSFSTALSAGVAAIWFAKHADELFAGDPAEVVPIFRSLVKQSARPLPPGDWKLDEYGAGIIDAAALMELPLSAAEPEAPPPEVSRGERIVKWLGRLVEEPADKVRSWLDRTFDDEDPEDAAVRVGTELASLSSEDEAVRRALKRAAAEQETGLPGPLRDRASESLKATATTAQPA